MEKEVIILGSSSPRRIQMMKEKGIETVIIKPECNEDIPSSISMEEAVMLLSLRKALEVEKVFLERKEKYNNLVNPFIVAADTVVYYNGIIGKPEDKDEARRILSMLRGKTHFVATGVSIIKAGIPIRRSFCEISEVTFTDYSDNELEAYINTDEPYDKAGGYAIQGYFGKYIKEFKGDINNIIGFPMERFLKEFKYIKKQML